MARAQTVQTCRWATPTLFLPWPLWYGAEQFEWSCTRAAEPRGIVDPAHCRTCAGWTRPGEDATHTEDHLGSVAP